MQVIILRGLPSSGKTTNAATLKNYVHCSADLYFTDAFDPAQLPAAHRWCRDSFRRALGENIVVDNTNLTAAEIAWYYHEAEDAGSDVVIKTFHTQYPGGKDIPQDTLDRMRATFNAAVLPPYWNYV